MRSPSLLLLLGSLAACGARTGLVVDARDAGPVPDVIAPLDVIAPVDVLRPLDLGSPPDAPTLACVWTSTPPVAITQGDRDRSPQSVRALDDRLWIGFQSSNPEPAGNQAWFVRLTDALGGPVAPAVAVLPSPGELTSYGPLSLWTSPTTRTHAAMAWTEGLGCRAVDLDDNARPSGAIVQVDRVPARMGDVACSSVMRHAEGWTFLSRDQAGGGVYNRFHAATVDGVATASAQLAPDNPTAVPARFVFDNGSFLYAFVATSPRGEPFVIVARHDFMGGQISTNPMIAPLRAGASISGFRFALDNDTVLIGWSEVTPTDGTDFVVARTDLDGALRVAPVAVVRAATTTGRAREFALAVAQGTPGVVWNPSTSGDEGVLRLTTLDPATLRPRGIADVATARFPRSVFLRGTSMGFVAVFGAIAPPTLTQVWTAPFRCVVPG
jgi:hypothetical protein